MHNADQLAAFCVWYLRCNYAQIYRRSAKLIGRLSPANQVTLSANRWPPVWYLREVDEYERMLLERQRVRSQRRSGATRTRTSVCNTGNEDDVGCLGFCSRKHRRRMRDVSTAGA